jgi:hypothetical protein
MHDHGIGSSWRYCPSAFGRVPLGRGDRGDITRPLARPLARFGLVACPKATEKIL